MRTNLRGIRTRVDRIADGLNLKPWGGCPRGSYGGHFAAAVQFWIGKKPEPPLPAPEICSFCGEPFEYLQFRIKTDDETSAA